jgi:hypothetical protein
MARRHHRRRLTLRRSASGIRQACYHHVTIRMVAGHYRGAMRGARVLTFAVVGVFAVCGAGAVMAADRVFSPASGETVAEKTADDLAERLNERLGYRNRPRDAASIVATEIVTDSPADQPAQGTRAVPVAWSGRIYSDEKATIDVRFTVTVSADSGFYGSGHTAGSATRCYRYTLQYYRYTEFREIDCPVAADPPPPSASPVLRLPGDAADRLTAALRTANPETLADAVRAAFPQDGFAIDTATTGGTLVAAVGVPAERDCLVMIRTPDGATKPIGFDRVQLEPGETGCRTALYTHPVR